jgi:hypothetical protein
VLGFSKKTYKMSQPLTHQAAQKQTRIILLFSERAKLVSKYCSISSGKQKRQGTHTGNAISRTEKCAHRAGLKGKVLNTAYASREESSKKKSLKKAMLNGDVSHMCQAKRGEDCGLTGGVPAKS